MATKRKSRRYDEGGEVDALESANASEDAQALADETRGDTILKRMRDEAAAAKSRSMARPKPAPAMGGARNTRSGPTADELASYAASRKAAPAKTGMDAIPTEGYRKVEGGERVSGNETTRNLNNIMNATAGLSVPGYVGKMTQAQYNARAAARRAAEGMSPAEALAARASQAAPKAAKAEKSVPTKGREEVTNPMMWAAGPKNAGAFKTAGKGPRKIKKALDESDTTGGAVGYKKGGNVRGWGMARGARKAKIV
jgi:hypothetical protein